MDTSVECTQPSLEPYIFPLPSISRRTVSRLASLGFITLRLGLRLRRGQKGCALPIVLMISPGVGRCIGYQRIALGLFWICIRIYILILFLSVKRNESFSKPKNFSATQLIFVHLRVFFSFRNPNQQKHQRKTTPSIREPSTLSTFRTSPCLSGFTS